MDSSGNIVDSGILASTIPHNVYAYITDGPGWKRFGKSTSNYATSGGSPTHNRIRINRSANNINAEIHEIELKNASGTIQVTSINDLVNSYSNGNRLVTGFRVTQRGQEDSYLEFYYNSNTANGVTIFIDVVVNYALVPIVATDDNYDSLLCQHAFDISTDLPTRIQNIAGVNRGEWVAGASYVTSNVVTYLDKLYYCMWTNSESATPNTRPDIWREITLQSMQYQFFNTPIRVCEVNMNASTYSVLIFSGTSVRQRTPHYIIFISGQGGIGAPIYVMLTGPNAQYFGTATAVEVSANNDGITASGLTVKIPNSYGGAWGVITVYNIYVHPNDNCTVVASYSDT